MAPRNHHHRPHNKTFPDAPADVSALLYFASLLLGLAVAVVVVVLLRQYYCARATRPGGLRDGSSPHPDAAEAPPPPPPWFASSGRVRGARRPRPADKPPRSMTMTTPIAAAERGGDGGELDMAAVAAPLWGYGAMYHKPGVSEGGTDVGEREDQGGSKKTEEALTWDCETPI